MLASSALGKMVESTEGYVEAEAAKGMEGSWCCRVWEGERDVMEWSIAPPIRWQCVRKWDAVLLMNGSTHSSYYCASLS